MSDFSSGVWRNFRNYMLKPFGDNAHQLDENLTFLNTKAKNNYVSKRLPYPLEEGSIVMMKSRDII